MASGSSELCRGEGQAELRFLYTSLRSPCPRCNVTLYYLWFIIGGSGPTLTCYLPPSRLYCWFDMYQHILQDGAACSGGRRAHSPGIDCGLETLAGKRRPTTSPIQQCDEGPAPLSAINTPSSSRKMKPVSAVHNVGVAIRFGSSRWADRQ